MTFRIWVDYSFANSCSFNFTEEGLKSLFEGLQNLSSLQSLFLDFSGYDISFYWVRANLQWMTMWKETLNEIFLSFCFILRRLSKGDKRSSPFDNRILYFLNENLINCNLLTFGEKSKYIWLMNRRKDDGAIDQGLKDLSKYFKNLGSLQSFDLDLFG